MRRRGLGEPEQKRASAWMSLSSWSASVERTKLVEDEWNEGAALFVAVVAVLADFCTGPGIQCLARLHFLVGGSMYIDARQVKQDGAVGHGDVAIR